MALIGDSLRYSNVNEQKLIQETKINLTFEEAANIICT